MEILTLVLIAIILYYTAWLLAKTVAFLYRALLYIARNRFEAFVKRPWTHPE